MLRLTVCVLALSLSQAAGQSCYAPSGGAQYNFQYIDTDSDGVIHMAEMTHYYNTFDTNHDGRVSRHEYTEYQISLDPTIGPFAHALYDAYDSDGDHHLDLHDFQAYYQRLDVDGNDNVNENEFVTYWVDLICRLAHLHHQWCVHECPASG